MKHTTRLLVFGLLAMVLFAQSLSAQERVIEIQLRTDLLIFSYDNSRLSQNVGFIPRGSYVTIDTQDVIGRRIRFISMRPLSAHAPSEAYRNIEAALARRAAEHVPGLGAFYVDLGPLARQLRDLGFLF